MNKQRRVGETIAIQSWLRPALTPVMANKDFVAFRDQLEQVKGLLKSSLLEDMAMDCAVEGQEGASARQLSRRKELALKALRVETLRMLLGNPSFREFSKTVAASELLADFCGVLRVDGIRGISKSTLERASKFFPDKDVRWMHQVLIEMSGGEKNRAQELGLESPVQTDVCLVDTTCLEANIHFPVDWVLLRDVSRTLLKATKLIRTAGLLCRMPCEPEQLARQMNNLCIEMTHSRRKQDGRKARKRVLRKMKPLLRTIAEHARSHRNRLESDYARTGYSLAQAEQIIARIDRTLAQVPAVITQAHERLIGERSVPSEQKLISIYEPDVKVIVRGKAGKEVEFGNTLFLAESAQGLILDWELYGQKAPPEWRQLQESIERQNTFDLPTEISAAGADRGFAAKAGKAALQASGIYDAVCPRNPSELKARLQEPQFVQLQRRRGSTEARVAIFKQRCARRLRSRGFAHRHLAVAWVVLGHNLWVVARMLIKQEKLKQAA
jgi:IS5 family transposase